MTPPTANNVMAPQPSSTAAAMAYESPYADSPDHLSFEEMREMPMHMALGFDVSNDE